MYMNLEYNMESVDEALSDNIPRAIDITKTELGRGFFSAVYLGYLDGKEVAVKRVSDSQSISATREEEAMKTFKHENIIKLYLTTADEHFKYYSLERCEASLDQLFLKDGDPKKFAGLMPPDEQVLLQIAEGLKYIHETPFLHRDIKPNNILISKAAGGAGSTCLVKLADFGLSRRVPSNDKSFSASGKKGTNTYMAPEYLKWSHESDEKPLRISVKIDIFSGGCTFFFYVTKGVHPFGEIEYKIIGNIVENNRVNFEKLEVRHFWLEDLLDGMLHPNPDERFSSEKVVDILKKANLPLQYDTRQLLGEGGFAMVFLGTYKGMPVAVKRSALMRDAEHSHRESDVLYALDHPNVMKLFHDENREPYRILALELCSASLDQLFLSDGNPKKFPGSMPSERDVLIQIVQGLHHVHSMGFIPRDVQPSNFLIAKTAPHCTVKLGGFGSSKRTEADGFYRSQSKMRGAFVRGTIGWMSPEIMAQLGAEGEQPILSTKSDIFSVGCVLFFYSTKGKHPFGNRGFDQIPNIAQGNAVNLNSLATDHFAYDSISGMIRKEPSERLKLEDAIQMLD